MFCLIQSDCLSQAKTEIVKSVNFEQCSILANSNNTTAKPQLVKNKLSTIY